MFPKLALFSIIFLTMIFPNTNFSQTPPLETGVSQSLAKWRSKNYSDIRYKLNITLEKGAPLMKGEIEIRVNLNEEGAKNDLILDWRTTQFANDKDKPFANLIQVNQIQFLDVPLTMPYAVDEVRILNEHLLVSPRFLKAGENVIKIKFASPIKTSGAAVTRYVDKEDGAEYVYSLFVPSDASTAFPVFDQPDLKARFKLSLLVPKNWIAISNKETLPGRLNFGFRLDNGEKLEGKSYFFEETKPISTYVFAFAAGDFQEFTEREADTVVDEIIKERQASKNNNGLVADTEVRQRTSHIYVRQSQAEKFKKEAAEVFRLNREGVKYLESYFDYKFPFPKYDLVLIPEFPFGGMEHAGATFLREDRVIFPTEPTKNDYITRANVIFHEAAHQWFGDTVTMKWFDDLWLKEGFAEFMAYKTLAKVMPEYNAWKIFYERNKQAAYLTDVTRGTTPIYQEIPNLSAAKSAYGNIVYRKAPSFLRQAEFLLGEDKFQAAVRAFLKKHEFANATWQDLINEFVEVKTAELKSQEYYQKLSAKEKASSELGKKNQTNEWANVWVKQRGMPIIRVSPELLDIPYETKKLINQRIFSGGAAGLYYFWQNPIEGQYEVNSKENNWTQNINVIRVFGDGDTESATVNLGYIYYRTIFDPSKEDENKSEVSEKEPKISKEREKEIQKELEAKRKSRIAKKPLYVFPNFQDYGYGIFLLDEKSRAYVLENIQNESDDFLRSMMWGSLWDSVRFYELAPEDYVKLVIKNINVETDESTIATLLGRVSIAMNYYIPEGGNATAKERADSDNRTSTNSTNTLPRGRVSASELSQEIENLLIEKMRNAPTVGQRITFYRAFLNAASSEKARTILKQFDDSKLDIIQTKGFQLKTKDKFDIVTRLLILGDKDAPQILAELEKTETSDEAKRYAYAAKAGIPTAENKLKYWNDFVSNKEISESWIESAFGVWNSTKHSELTLPYLEKSLAELPNLKKNRKIFFVNGWLSSFIGGQKSEEALKIVNKFLNDNPNLDKDLRNKILENVDNLERAVKIRAKFASAK